ncbi:MAG TPA: thiamine-phosphate kinase [Stellaceae bacterium]|jgi:thiamine-monophosphate kinase|nr:thiamine-phosphate kinase [Stellaceae bacterium]
MAESPADETPGEFERIRRYFAPLAGPGGLGLLDDAALVECRADQRLVMTADAIVAGVHFLPEDPPDLVAKKLLRVNLSDLAAMGARPLHYLLTTALPVSLGAGWVAEFARGLGEDQRLYGIDLIGGDSVSTAGPAALSLTAIGEVAAGAEIRRSGARAGDDIWVSGTIGDAYLGLGLLRGAAPRLAAEHRTALIRRFQLPEPRVILGPALSGVASAMIDVSDGLLADLGHICETSHLAGVVELASLPMSPAARAVVVLEPDVAPQLATGGDDYELLFTAPSEAVDAVRALGSQLAVPVTRIGRIEAGDGVRLVDAGGREVTVEASGYRHF